MAKGGPDVNDPDEKQGGFATGDTDITGFSHMHDSGTGGVRSATHKEELILICSNRRLHWAIFLSSFTQAAPEMILTTANSQKEIEP